MSSETSAVSAIVAVTPITSETSRPDGRPRARPELQTTDYRLVIEQGPRAGTFIYKTVDRTTGETIRQFPREEVVRLVEDPRYAKGTIASTRA